MSIRHSVTPRLAPRGVTAGRLAAARRALRRERDRLPLFAGQVAREQLTPAERIELIDNQLLDYDQAHRDLAAMHWRRGRLWLAGIAQEVRDEIVELWNRKTCPPRAAYFCDFVRREFQARAVSLSDDAAYDDYDAHRTK